MDALRYHHPLTKVNRSHGIADDTRAQTGFVGHVQVPGGPDTCIAVDVAAGRDRGAKGPEEPSAPEVQGSWRRPKEEQPDDMPGKPREAVAKGETWPLQRLVVSNNHLMTSEPMI